MTQNKKRIIFLNSYWPRTGHNFASEVLKVFSDHQVLAHNKSETRLSTLLNSYYQIYDSIIFHESDKIFFDSLFINDLREKILSKADRDFIMIKDTSFLGVEKLPLVFPEDLHFLLVRDPKRVFNSLFKSMRLGKRTFKNFLKKAGILTGLYPYYYSRKVSREILKTLPDLNNHRIIKYEDLVTKNNTTLIRLAEVFGTAKSLEQIKTEIENIPVINSSFFEEVKAKNIWDQKSKTADFNPLYRKGNSYLVRKGIILGSLQLRKKLNYI